MLVTDARTETDLSVADAPGAPTEEASRLVNFATALRDKNGTLYKSAMNHIMADRSAELDALLRQVDELPELDEYDEDFMAPEAASVATARDFLERAGAFVDGYFPKGHAYPDGDGGVGLQWTRADAKVAVLIPRPGAGGPSVYYRWSETDYGTLKETEPRNLSDLLNAFNRDAWG